MQSEVLCKMFSTLRQLCLNQSIIAWGSSSSHLPETP